MLTPRTWPPDLNFAKALLPCFLSASYPKSAVEMNLRRSRDNRLKSLVPGFDLGFDAELFNEAASVCAQLPWASEIGKRYANCASNSAVFAFLGANPRYGNSPYRENFSYHQAN